MRALVTRLCRVTEERLMLTVAVVVAEGQLVWPLYWHDALHAGGLAEGFSYGGCELRRLRGRPNPTRLLAASFLPHSQCHPHAPVPVHSERWLKRA